MRIGAAISVVAEVVRLLVELRFVEQLPTVITAPILRTACGEESQCHEKLNQDRRINNCRIHFVPPADADLWSSRLGGNLALPNLRQ